MSAGTITLTNGSAIVGGTGTSFATELAAGDFIVSAVGGVPYTLPVKTVDSNTQVTLVSNFTGPTQAGAAWSAVPRVALNMVTAALVAQSAEALRGLNYDKQNWHAIFSDNGNITVRLPDGSTFYGPSWKYIANLLKNMDVDQLQQLADAIHTDVELNESIKIAIEASQADVAANASQVATDAAQVAADKEQIELDKAAAAQAASDALQSKEDAAESARQAGASNPQLALQKSLNLSDLADRDEAWKNVRPTGPTNLAADPVNDLDSATMGWVKRFVASVKSVIDSWAVIKNDASSPASGSTVIGGEITSIYQIAGVNISRMSFRAKAVIGGTAGGEIVVYDDRGTGSGKSWQLPDVGGTILGSADIGSSGAKIPRLNASNSWSATQTIASNTLQIGGGAESSSGNLYWSNANILFRLSTTHTGPVALAYMFENMGVSSGLKLEVRYNSTRNDYDFRDSGTATAVNWSSTSEGQLKGNIKRVENALSATLSMRGVTWDWNKKGLAGVRGVGIVAQEAEEWCPEAVEYLGPAETLSGDVVDNARSLNVGAVAAAYHTEAIRALFGMVKRLAEGEATAVLEEIAEVESLVKPFYRNEDPQAFDAPEPVNRANQK